MSFTPAFTVSQSVNPNAFTLNDTSVGSDVAITGRRIYLYTADNSTLVPTGINTAYVDFPLSDGASIVLNVLNVDYALMITVQWLNVSNAVLYTLTQYFSFTANDETFLFNLSTMQSSKPSIIQDQLYLSNKFLLRLYVDSANQAISKGNDVYKAQLELDMAQALINNQIYTF